MYPALCNQERRVSRSWLRSSLASANSFAEIFGLEQRAVMFELGGAIYQHKRFHKPSHGHIAGEDGELVFRHACGLGCKGIVSKHKGSPYPSSRSSDWIKMKDPASPAVRRGRGLGMTYPRAFPPVHRGSARAREGS